MGITGNVRITEDDVDRILSDSRCVHCKIGFLVSLLIYTQAEVVPSQFLASLSMKAQR